MLTTRKKQLKIPSLRKKVFIFPSVNGGIYNTTNATNEKSTQILIKDRKSIGTLEKVSPEAAANISSVLHSKNAIILSKYNTGNTDNHPDISHK